MECHRMTDAVNGADAAGERQEPSKAATRERPVDDQLAGILVDRTRAEGLQLTGEGGLLGQLTKRVPESALDGEMSDHLGYEKHDGSRVLAWRSSRWKRLSAAQARRRSCARSHSASSPRTRGTPW